MKKEEIKTEIVSDAGKIALLLPDLYISPESVMRAYDKLSTKALLDIEEWKELKREVVKSVA